MKKSNQLLLGGLFSVFLGALLFLLLLRTMSSQKDLDQLIHFSSSSHTVHGNGKMISSSKKLPAFKKIFTSGFYKITLKSGTESLMTFKADENILPHLSSNVENEQLFVRWDRQFKMFPSHPIEIEITSPNITDITVGGENTLNAIDFHSDNLNITLGGDNKAMIKVASQNVALNLGGRSTIDMIVDKSQSLKINSGGASVVKLSGATDALTINNGGSLKINAPLFTADDVAITGSGHTDVMIHANKQILINAMGEAKLKYCGAPTIINHSLGNIVIRKELHC